MDQLTFLSEEHHAKASQLQGCKKDWMMIVATWHSSSFALLKENAPIGFFGKTSPASCHLTKDKTLLPFSEAWRNSGMGSPTEFLTLNTSEYHKNAEECSLLHIVETGDIPQRCYLKKKTCDLFLDRLQVKGASIPESLMTFIQSAARR